MTFRAEAAVIAVALAGCASAPTRFLSLVPPADESAAAAPLQVPVVSVTIPSQVDQPELVVRLADGSMAVLESERWIAPLGDEFRSALTLALMRRPDTVAGRIQVNVQRFDSVPGQYALIEAVWTLVAPGSPARHLTCRSSIRIAVGPGYPALVAGHRAAIEELASQIDARARPQSVADPSCEPEAAAKPAAAAGSIP